MESKLDKILNSYNTANPFRVPENYFVQFNGQIMNRLPEKEAVLQPKTVSMWSKAKPLLYMAAMLAGLYLCFNILTRNDNFNVRQTTQYQTFVESADNANYWANIHITEEEFFQFIEQQVLEEQVREFMYFQLLWN